MAAFVLLGTAGTANAQGDSVYYTDEGLRACQSTWTSYNNFMESSSIVRSNVGNHVVHTQRKDAQTGMRPHTFIMKRASSSTEMAFTTYFNAEDSISDYVDVTDMRLFDDTCYFCGTKVSTFAYPNGQYVSHGIVGRFVPDHMLNGTGSISFFEVVETAHLTRLAISRASGSKVLISAIGDMDRTGTACIVEMTPCGGSSWDYWLDTLETPVDVIFSDIMTMRDSIRLLVQYKCSNNYLYGFSGYDNRHQLFMLDRFDLRGCKYNYTNTPGVYYMAHYDMGLDGDWFFHYNKAPMRFSHLNDLENQFGVAFGVEEKNIKFGGLRLFPFQHEWRYDSCIYYRMGRNTEIKEVGNQYGTETVVLLSKDNIRTNGVATLPKLGLATHDVTRLYTNSYTMNSFTQKFVGNHIDISGHGSSYVLHLLDQDVTTLSLPSCFSKFTLQYTPLPGQRAAYLVAKWYIGKKTNFFWENAIMFNPEITKTTVCEECNN